MSLRERNVYVLARLGVGYDAIERVNRALPAIQRAHEAECSIPEGPERDRFVAAGEAAWKRLCRAMEGWSRGLGAVPGVGPFTIARQGDPRGACVILTVDGAEHRLAAMGFTADELDRVCMAAGG